MTALSTVRTNGPTILAISGWNRQTQGYETYCRIRRNLKTLPLIYDVSKRPLPFPSGNSMHSVWYWHPWSVFTAFPFVFVSQPSGKQRLGYDNKTNGKAVINGPAVSGLIGMHWVSTRKGQAPLGYVVIKRQSYEIPTDLAVGFLPLDIHVANVE